VAFQGNIVERSFDRLNLSNSREKVGGGERAKKNWPPPWHAECVVSRTSCKCTVMRATWWHPEFRLAVH